MTAYSHLPFQSTKWEECLCEKDCCYGTKINVNPDEIANLPESWIWGLVGDFADSAYSRVWLSELEEGPGSALVHHRTDGPAIVYYDGAREWYQYGKLHRDNGPAIIRVDGTEVWYQNGELHRDNGPAFSSPDGTQLWYQNDKLHSENSPAVVYADGTREWHNQGRLHSLDGPAIIRSDGTQEWYINGLLQTENNPNLIEEYNDTSISS